MTERSSLDQVYHHRRDSFYLYNTPAKVETLVDALHRARELFGY